MEHEEMVNEFLKQELKEGDLVELLMINGDRPTGILSSSIVRCEIGENGKKFDSRIGLLPPPATPGKVTPITITPVYCERIVSIRKITV